MPKTSKKLKRKFNSNPASTLTPKQLAEAYITVVNRLMDSNSLLISNDPTDKFSEDYILQAVFEKYNA